MVHPVLMLLELYKLHQLACRRNVQENRGRLLCLTYPKVYDKSSNIEYSVKPTKALVDCDDYEFLYPQKLIKAKLYIYQ